MLAECTLNWTSTGSVFSLGFHLHLVVPVLQRIYYKSNQFLVRPDFLRVANQVVNYLQPGLVLVSSNRAEAGHGLSVGARIYLRKVFRFRSLF